VQVRLSRPMRELNNEWLEFSTPDPCQTGAEVVPHVAQSLGMVTRSGAFRI
jgi:hypothetical protein